MSMSVCLSVPTQSQEQCVITSPCTLLVALSSSGATAIYYILLVLRMTFSGDSTLQ